MNGCRDDRRWCYFHPRELVVGVCALCLNERLLVLSSKQTSHRSSVPKKSLPKIFALRGLLNIKHNKSHEDYNTSSTSQEDSFISIRFENNGVASWDKGKISKMPFNQKGEAPANDKGKISRTPLDQKGEMPVNDNLDKIQKIKSVVEHAKPRGTLRWRKRIGHLFQVMRWKRSKPNKGNKGTKLEGAKVKYGWIRALTKRRTKE